MWLNIIIGTLVLAVIPFFFAAYGGHLATKEFPSGERRKIKINFWFLFFLGLAFGFVQQYRAETAQEASQRKIDAVQRRNEAAQNQVQEQLRSLVQQGQGTKSLKASPLPKINIPKKPSVHQSLSSPPQENPVAAEIQRRRMILDALRNEYLLSHDNISPGLVAGTEYPPTEWMNKRLSELKEQWRFNESKDEMILRANKIAGDLDDCANELMKQFDIFGHLDLDDIYPQYHHCAEMNISGIILKTEMLMLSASPCDINPQQDQLRDLRAATTFTMVYRPISPDAVFFLQQFNQTLAQELRSVASKLQAGKCPQS